MRLTTLAVALWSMTSLQLAAAAVTAVTAPITEVILYPGSASIVRTVQVAPGRTQVEIGGLPASFDKQTLHAVAGAGIVVGEVVTRDAARTEAISPVEADLDAKMQSLIDQQAVLDADIKSREIVKSYLERLGGDSAAGNDKSTSPGDAKRLAGIVDTIGTSAKEALLKIQALTIQKRELQKKIDAIGRDLARQRSGDSDARSVSIDVSAERAGTVTLSYQINNAGWKPGYRASLNSSTSQLELDRLAVVSQKTGEDWSNVKMTLSTNQPSLSPVGPEPQPWLLRYDLPVASQAYSSAGLMPRQAYAVKAVAAPPPSMDAKVMQESDYIPPIMESQSTFATQFQVPYKVNLISDGREVTLTLGSQRLQVKQFLRITPALSNAAIVMAEAEREKGVWLKGSMQLIRDGNYVGAVTWNPASDEKFQFSFGRDDLIKVEKVDLKTDSGSTGFLDKKSQRVIALQYNVTNSHRSNVDLEVLDSSPVSTSDEIQVNAVFDPKPATDAWMHKRGVVAWYKNLAPDNTAKFTVHYVIDFPKEGRVSGLR